MHATPEAAPPAPPVENPYRPPAGRPRVLPAPVSSAAPVVLRLLILAFCCFQYVVLTYHMVGNWDMVTGAIESGRIPLLDFALGYAAALVLMLAGVFLLFRRTPAIWLFVANLLWQLYGLERQLWQAYEINAPYTSFLPWTAVASVACVAGCVWYGVSLRRRGLMR